MGLGMDVLHLSDAIKLVAAELDDMREASTLLQEVVSDLVIEGASQNTDSMNTIQRLDRMTQELSDLAPFLERISLYAEEFGHPDVSTATESINLDSLRLRLQRAPESSVNVIPGEPELF